MSALTDERGKDYGDFGANARRTAQMVMALDIDMVKHHSEEAVYPMLMIAVKLARLSHNPTHLDSWKDIAGYAELMINQLEVTGLSNPLDPSGSDAVS